jgi:hypothetical protein
LNFPEELRKKVIISTAISKDFVLLATPDTLYCWNTDTNATFSVQVQLVVSINSLKCLNSKAGITSFANEGDVFVVVALESGEVRLYNLYLTQGKFELNKTIHTGDKKISRMRFV